MAETTVMSEQEQRGQEQGRLTYLTTAIFQITGKETEAPPACGKEAWGDGGTGKLVPE